MAGLTLSAGFSAIVGFGTPATLGQAARNLEGEKNRPSQIAAKEGKSPDKQKESAGSSLSVQLKLGVAGLGSGGCDVEVKPANPSCRFRPVKRHISASGDLESFVIRDIEIRGADRNCSFAITVTEAGQKPRTILRGFRVAARDEQEPNAAMQSFVCYLSSPSKIARIEGTTTRK